MTATISSFPLGLHWPTFGPFLFCAHHYDFYPKGNEGQGIDPVHFKGRSMGQDFVEKDGFRLYHGAEIPGFPVHPHRGFETITVVRKGLVDHADSLGAAGRYGQGDVQWMTAGSGIQHSEMFPLVHPDKENTLELFQIWLNLPRASKMVPAHFTMFWANEIPLISEQEGRCEISLIAGQYKHHTSLSAPPDSWASNPENEVLIALIKLKSGASFTLPASKSKTSRSAYFFVGEKLKLNGVEMSPQTGTQLEGQTELTLFSEGEDTEVLILQAKEINEPVVQHGPFVMNSREEIMKTIADYQKTQFGGWPWPRRDMVHGSSPERFARYPDGRIVKPKSSI